MDPNLHESSQVLFDDQGMEPAELLEENWFFGNLLDGSKSRMFRSYSDPCTTSSFFENSYDDVYESIQKLPGDMKLTRFNLVKAPSMPSSIENRSCKNSKSKGKSSPASVLSRTPSLPVSLATDEIQDEEIEFSMGKLIRQASMSTADVLTPTIHSSKNLTPSPSLSRHQSRMKPVLDSIKSAGLDGIRTQRSVNQLKVQTSLIIVESKQLQRARDTPIDSNPHTLSPNPCLQEKKRIDDSKEKYNKSRQYLSDKWRANSSSPPVPKWSSKKSVEDIMKEQIKFWARAVASNVN